MEAVLLTLSVVEARQLQDLMRGVEDNTSTLNSTSLSTHLTANALRVIQVSSSSFTQISSSPHAHTHLTANALRVIRYVEEDTLCVWGRTLSHTLTHSHTQRLTLTSLVSST
jgi:hypothetical protein